MTKLEENMKAHPEWYVDPSEVTGQELAFLEWQEKQTPPWGGKTIGEAWAETGKGRYYKENVVNARAMIERAIRQRDVMVSAGLEYKAPEWLK